MTTFLIIALTLVSFRIVLFLIDFLMSQSFIKYCMSFENKDTTNMDLSFYLKYMPVIGLLERLIPSLLILLAIIYAIYAQVIQ